MLIIAVLVSIFFIIVHIKTGEIDCVTEFILSIIVYALFSLIVVIASSAIEIQINGSKTTEITNTHIVTLKDGQSVGGSFFLGSGYINSSLQYITYTEVSPSNFKMSKFVADDVEINEDINVTANTAYIESFVTVSDISFSVFPFKTQFHSDPNYRFHVPVGTITRVLILDSE